MLSNVTETINASLMPLNSSFLSKIPFKHLSACNMGLPLWRLPPIFS